MSTISIVGRRNFFSLRKVSTQSRKFWDSALVFSGVLTFSAFGYYFYNKSSTSQSDNLLSTNSSNTAEEKSLFTIKVPNGSKTFVETTIPMLTEKGDEPYPQLYYV
jgi:hypothetical protein